MTWVSYGTESHVCQKAQWVKKQQQLILVICVFAVGMHYLHSEAPIKVIHRDLKSRNGKIFHLQSCHYYICALGQTLILELFYFLSSSCCDCRQSPEGGFTSWPAHSQSVRLHCQVYEHLAAVCEHKRAVTYWAWEEPADSLTGVIMATWRSFNKPSWQMIGTFCACKPFVCVWR